MTGAHSFTWMQDPIIVRVMTALGAPHTDVRFVGGCVRDALAGRSVSDIDVATPDVPDVVMSKLKAAGINAIPTGLAHGTITAVVDARHVEITTLRRDTACDGRHAAVEFTTDWTEDARRRDFTFNALSLRITGELFDPAGGQADLATGRVRFIGKPIDRIKEDYLRILRLFRFHAHFGKVPIDDATLVACASLRDGLKALSTERVTAELSKLLNAPNPMASLTAMRGCGVLAVVLPEATQLQALSDLIALEEKLPLKCDWRGRLAALLTITNVRSLAVRLRLSNADADFVQALVAEQPSLSASTDATALDMVLYRQGREITLNRCLVGAARAPASAWRPLITRAAAWTPKPMPLTGDDLIASGFLPGPAIGAALRDAEDVWVTSGFVAEQEVLLACAMKHLHGY
jgi:poly(A) polymerase